MSTTKARKFSTIEEALEALDVVRLAEAEARKDKTSRTPGTTANLALKACKAERRAVVTACRSIGIVLTDSGVVYSTGNGKALTHVEEKRIVEVSRISAETGMKAEDIAKLSLLSESKLTFRSRKAHVEAVRETAMELLEEERYCMVDC